MSRSWWQRASLRTDEDFGLERRVTWLEHTTALLAVLLMLQLVPMGYGIAVWYRSASTRAI
jgi:hypothetical protein